MDSRSQKVIDVIKLPLLFIAVIWVIHLVQFGFELHLGYLGLLPRDFSGIRGILLAPLLHADFAHLTHNSIPLFVLSSLILYFYPRVAMRSFTAIYLLTGLMVWLIGNYFFCGLEYGHQCKSYHIGASGVVYGLATFIMGNGIFRKNIKSVALALIILFYYSGMFVGILPVEEGVSWESHLYGAIVGFFVAYYFKHELEEDEKPVPPSWASEDPANTNYFFARDTFEKTKLQRKLEEEARLRNENGEDWVSDRT